MIISQRLVVLESDAIHHTLQEWKDHHPQMGVVALLPEAEAGRLPVLQQACREQQVALCGALFPALVTDTGFVQTGAWLICMDPMPPWFLLPELEASGNQKLLDATRTALAQAPAGGTPTLFMVFDGMVPNISTLLEGLHDSLDMPVEYSGVSAGSETFAPMPCLFDQHSVIGFGALGLVLPAPTRAVTRHGYPVSQRLMRATSSVDNRIDAIDNQPAFEVYQQVIAHEYGVTRTGENFYDYAVHFPFGVITAVDVLVRIPVAFTDGGALVCVGEVSPNSMLRLLRAPTLGESTCVQSLTTALDTARAGSGSTELLTFYCAGRRMHFGEEAARELAQLRTSTGATTLYGALSLGEIDCMEDLNIPRFHNAALVCIPGNNRP